MPPKPAGRGSGGEPSKAQQKRPNPGRNASAIQSTQSTQENTDSQAAVPKKRKHRGGKKHRRHRRQSFAPTEASDINGLPQPPDPREVAAETAAARNSFYRIHQGNNSNTSVSSDALLDHRDNGPLQARRQSIQQGLYPPRTSHQSTQRSPIRSTTDSTIIASSSNLSHTRMVYEEDEDDNYDAVTDRTPLIATTKAPMPSSGYGGFGGSSGPGSRQRSRPRSRQCSRPRSITSSVSRRSRPRLEHLATSKSQTDFDVNNPPSVPGSPLLGGSMGYDDAMLTAEITTGRSPQISRTPRPGTRDALIDISGDDVIHEVESTPPSPKQFGRERRHTMSHPAEEDVCFPIEGMSEIGQDDYMEQANGQEYHQRRRRRRQWPDLAVLEEWSREEKEERTMEGIRVRKVSEPLMIGGRLRPLKHTWHRQDDDAPYRFTYFNEEFQNTIHSQTISELLQEGQTFRDLFIPDPPLLSDEESDDEEEDDLASRFGGGSISGGVRTGTRLSSRVGDASSKLPSGEQTGASTPVPSSTFPSMDARDKQPRYGARPVFWLDVLSPTDTEMKVISKAFGIHPLTSEDIMMQEAREKVELFRHYYFVNYRTFEQDPNSEDYLEPVNMFVVVFREGVISFHFSQTPHPANVRRRIRQLSDYLVLSSDWISYAIIDDITDVYAPLIQKIEEEVDDIDDSILRMHMTEDEAERKQVVKSQVDMYEKLSDSGESLKGASDANMLLRVGECRKKVMGLYRLLGNKADVIKGFAKRCTEQWDVAPRSEIGLYLGDIQDHIVTMTGNLTHYESLLSRAHGNYLAQINIRMNERQEQTADVLGKLTVLGTIVLPMNIITGMWGMNVMVPGQEVESLWWFWGITAGLIMFGLSSFAIAKRVYGIV